MNDFPQPSLEPVSAPDERPDRLSDEEFARLLEKNSGLIDKVAMKFTRHPEKAKDLAQDTRLRAWRYRAKYKPGNFNGWIYIMMRRYFLGQIEKLEARSGWHMSYDENADKDDQPHVAHLADERFSQSAEVNIDWDRAREIYAKVIDADSAEETYFLVDVMRKACLEPGIAHAIARSITNPKWRSIFVLYSLLDITYKDVAYALGIPHGTVMSGLSRARELLQGSELAIRVLQKFASERVGMVFAEAS